jgi:hypothetical protein
LSCSISGGPLNETYATYNFDSGKFKRQYGGGGEGSDDSNREWEDEEARELGNAKFHDGSSDDTSMCFADSDDDES